MGLKLMAGWVKGGGGGGIASDSNCDLERYQHRGFVGWADDGDLGAEIEID